MKKTISMTEFIEKIQTPEKFNTKGAKFEVNPIQDFLLKKQMATSEAFARAYFTEMTETFYEYLKFKIENRENIAIGIKGETRNSFGLLEVGNPF